MASDSIALALIRELCRDGSLDGDSIERIAGGLDAQGLADAAHAVRCELVNSAAPEPAEWNAEKRRKRLSIVSPDGGNDAA